MGSTNYVNTLIAVSEDCGARHGTIPPEKIEHPYIYTSDDVIFTVWADRQGVPDEDRQATRHEFFNKGRACLRASDLGKKYGWGIHNDAEGRVALFGVETEEYPPPA